MLKNITYMGIMRNGDVRSEIIPELQIIPPKLFELARKQIESHRTSYEKSRISPLRKEGTALLSGNIYCAHCGGRLSATTARKSHHKTNVEAVRTPVYRCYGKLNRRTDCDGQSTYRAEKVDAAIEKAVHWCLERVQLTDATGYVEKLRQQELNSLKQQLQALEKKRQKAMSERNGLGEHMLSALNGKGPFTADDLQDRMDFLQTECEDIVSQMEMLKGAMEECTRREKLTKAQFELQKDYAAIYDGADIQQKREIVSAIIEKVLVGRGYDIQISFRIGTDILDAVSNANEES